MRALALRSAAAARQTHALLEQSAARAGQGVALSDAVMAKLTDIDGGVKRRQRSPRSRKKSKR